MAAAVAAHDWRATPLGPIEAWPQSLKTAVGIMLTSRYAMWMLWGPELTFFCNDAYRPTLGVKGDWALGARSDRVWAEIWAEIGPRIETVLDHRRRHLGRGAAACSSSAAAIPRRPTTPSPTAPCATTPVRSPACCAWSPRRPSA